MSQELLTILQPVLLSLIVSVIAPIIVWLSNRRKAQADSSQIIVDAATDATKNLLEPLTKRVVDLDNEVTQLRSDRAICEARMDVLDREYASLEENNTNLRSNNLTLTERVADLENENLNMRQERNTLRIELDKANQRIAALEKEYADVKATSERREQDNRQLSSDNTLLRNRNAELLTILTELSARFGMREALYKKLEGDS